MEQLRNLEPIPKAVVQASSLDCVLRCIKACCPVAQGKCGHVGLSTSVSFRQLKAARGRHHVLHALLPGSTLRAVRNTVGCSDALCVLQDYQRLLSTQPPRRLNTAKLAESSALKVGALTPHTAGPPLPHTQHADGLRHARRHLSLRAREHAGPANILPAAAPALSGCGAPLTSICILSENSDAAAV